MKIYVVSLGCPKNRVDTENLLGALVAPEIIPVDDPSQADLALVNTCGFIQPAVEESVRAILELLQDIEEASPRPKVVVAGCLVSRYGAEELARELPGVDLFLSTRELENWPSLAGRLGLAAESGRSRRREPTASAYLKVAEGCDRHCAFCAIPGIRGPLKSRQPEELVREAESLLAHGAKELILVAQDLTAYGRDLGLAHGLMSLLERLLPLDGLAWLRMLYLNPTGLTDDFLDFAAKAGPPLLPYFDVPLQHAHPEVLKAMGRPFAQDPRLVVERIRRHLPEAALRTTLIAGYPGEGPEEFQALLDFTAWARFDHLGVFAYWPEEGTAAAGLKRRPPKKERERRRDEVMQLQAEISEEILEGLVGLEMDVLVEAPHAEWPGLHTGRVWRQAPEVDGLVYVSGPGVAPDALVKARIVESKIYDLVALA